MIPRLVAATAAALLLAAPAFAETIRVGVTAGPHARILEQVAKEAQKAGLEVKIVEFSDYIIPNQALALQDLEANSFQHEPYLRNQIAKTGWKLTKVATTVTLPLGIYSKKFKSLAELPQGATVAIPNDPSNGARGLRVLAGNGLIKLRDGAAVTVGITDIVDNPKKLKIVELDAAQLPRSLGDVDAAAVNSNYALEFGLDPVKDPIVREPLESPWVNIIAVREEDKDKPWVAVFVKAYRSDAVKQFVNDTFKGSLVPAW